ncbi:MAG: YlzJ-like family protein [Cellulosilyticaceae bacterium]
MALYSILPIATDEEVMRYEMLEYQGKQVLACVTPEGYVMERLYSSDPSDYLDNTLQPGILLENSLIKKNIQ